MIRGALLQARGVHCQLPNSGLCNRSCTQQLCFSLMSLLAQWTLYVINGLIDLAPMQVAQQVGSGLQVVMQGLQSIL